jgi:hypothetical protein
MRSDGHQFVHQNIVEFALQYDPLLYAVVGFAAYHHCVQTGTGKLYTFLKYYNMALKLLRKSLGSGEEHWEATLITVLVLTTFEVGFQDHRTSRFTSYFFIFSFFGPFFYPTFVPVLLSSVSFADTLAHRSPGIHR